MKDVIAYTSLFICFLALAYRVETKEAENLDVRARIDQVRQELKFEINRVQDRSERDLGELNEKLDMIESLLARKY